MRAVSWFSCGAASAVATKMALKEKSKYDEFIVACCVVKNEHVDNERFLNDCEKWFDYPILRLKSDKYDDAWDVWEKTRFLVGPYGARCTTELKKKVRQKFQKMSDVQIFGFTSEEAHRAKRFEEQNPEVKLNTPLIDLGISKNDCLDILYGAGIEIPTMYKLGYKNNNCIGCVKGGKGYWAKIKRDFPEIFDRMAKLERTLDASILKDKNGRLFLDEFDVTKYKNIQDDMDFQCGLWCGGDLK